MPKINQDQALHFRANSALADASSDAAKAEGLSLSAFMRRAMEREVEATASPEGEISHPVMVALASSGNHSAQAQLAQHYLMGDGHVSRDLNLALGLTWASMAAHSGTVRDLCVYASALLWRYQYVVERSGNAERDALVYLSSNALAVIDVCADAGHVPSQFLAVELASRTFPEAVTAAKSLKASIKINPLSADETEADYDLASLANAIAALEGVA